MMDWSAGADKNRLEQMIFMMFLESIHGLRLINRVKRENCRPLELRYEMSVNQNGD